MGQQHGFSEVSKIFDYASSSGAEVAVNLRKCAIRHFIACQVAELVGNRLLLPKAPGTRESEDMVQTVHSSPKLNKHEKTVWRLITVKAVEERDRFGMLAKDMSARIIGKIEYLTEKGRQNRLNEELMTLFRVVLDLWDSAQRDSCELKINMVPPSTNDGMWKNIDIDGDGGNTATPTAKGTKTNSFAIFPRITGEFETEKDDESNTEILHSGIGLFSDSPAFEMGLAEFEALKKELNCVHKRHASITSPTMTDQQHSKLHIKTTRRNNGSV